LWDNLLNPWFDLFLYLPVALFIMRLNRGGWPKWVVRIVNRIKLLAPKP